MHTSSSGHPARPAAAAAPRGRGSRNGALSAGLQASTPPRRGCPAPAQRRPLSPPLTTHHPHPCCRQPAPPRTRPPPHQAPPSAELPPPGATHGQAAPPPAPPGPRVSAGAALATSPRKAERPPGTSVSGSSHAPIPPSRCPAPGRPAAGFITSLPPRALPARSDTLPAAAERAGARHVRRALPLSARPPAAPWGSPGSTCGTGRPRSSGWWPAPGATRFSWRCAASGAVTWPCPPASTSSSGTRGKERR